MGEPSGGGSSGPDGLPGTDVSMGSTSCLILISGTAALAAVLLAAGWVGGATTLAIEAGMGGATAMAAGTAERAAADWEGGAAAVRRAGTAWEGCCAGVGVACCWGCGCSPVWLGRASTAVSAGGAMATWMSDLGFTLQGKGSPECYRDALWAGGSASRKQSSTPRTTYGRRRPIVPTHPAGRGDPEALLMAPSSLGLVASLGWAGIRLFLTADLKEKQNLYYL